jgi:hypothetical protein
MLQTFFTSKINQPIGANPPCINWTLKIAIDSPGLNPALFSEPHCLFLKNRRQTAETNPADPRYDFGLYQPHRPICTRKPCPPTLRTLFFKELTAAWDLLSAT